MPTFDTPNSQHTWTVPSGVSTVQVRAIGGSGGQSDSNYSDPGSGGEILGMLSVDGVNDLIVSVGDDGTSAENGGEGGLSPLGDGGDGGRSGESYNAGGGGGAASGVARASDGTVMAVGEGGGGEGGEYDGGGGGSRGGAGGAGYEDVTSQEDGQPGEGTGNGGAGGDGNTTDSDERNGENGGVTSHADLSVISTGASANGPLVEILLPVQDAPTLSATPVSDTRIDLDWTAVGQVETYEIERRPAGGSWSQIASVGAGTTTYQDTGLVSGGAYDYRVTATNSVNSETSDTVQVSTVIPAPTGLQAVDVRATEIDIEWADNADGEQGYRVYTSTDGGSTWTQEADLAADTESYTITGLLNGEQYDIRVEAYNQYGTASTQ